MLRIAAYLLITLTTLSPGCPQTVSDGVVTGAEALEEYLPFLEGKRVAVVANQTSMVGPVHLVDTLLSRGVDLRIIFAPEHGFRQMADAGDHIAGGSDPETGVEIVSLYGSKNKPTPESLSGVDVVLFDIQDVGARFYTYISTMHYVMEACAEEGKLFVVLDRPNPNGFYVDGPLLKPDFKSFVGMHPVPVVHGMTIGEYARMINGEGWLKGGVQTEMRVIPVKNWDHKTPYELPVKPSPNLPNQNSVYLYPSLCFFEGTNISLGRGTSFPFQVFGSPLFPNEGFHFVPAAVPGAMNPPLLGQICYGVDLRKATEAGIVPKPYLLLEWVVEAYSKYPDKSKFFTSYFDKLAGNSSLREMIISGSTPDEIRTSWQSDLEQFRNKRRKYLLYSEGRD